jgi:hypothetical protein
MPVGVLVGSSDSGESAQHCAGEFAVRSLIKAVRRLRGNAGWWCKPLGSSNVKRVTHGSAPSRTCCALATSDLGEW